MLYNYIRYVYICNRYNMYMRVGMSCYDVICSLTLFSIKKIYFTESLSGSE